MLVNGLEPDVTVAPSSVNHRLLISFDDGRLRDFKLTVVVRTSCPLPCEPGLSPTTSHLVHAAVDLLTCCELVMYVI